MSKSNKITITYHNQGDIIKACNEHDLKIGDMIEIIFDQKGTLPLSVKPLIYNQDYSVALFAISSDPMPAPYVHSDFSPEIDPTDAEATISLLKEIVEEKLKGVDSEF